MSRSFAFAVTLLVMLAPLAFANSWLPSFNLGGRSALVFDTDPVSVGPIRRVIATSGPVRPLVTVSVGSQLSGQIRALKADFNSEVKAGDELAVIDDTMFAARVEQAKADLAANRAALVNHEAVLLKAEASDRFASRLLSRQQRLSDKGVVAASALDNATRDAALAQAEIAIAKAQVEQTRAMVRQREAQLAQAQIDFERTRIRSPIDGTVITRTVDVGQTVAASLQAPELFKIAQDLRSIRIEAQISEADVGAVAAGSAVEFKVDAYPERRFRGRVAHVRLGPAETNNVITYTVIIDTDNADRKLLPGMTAEARIESEFVAGALRVSIDALRFKPRHVPSTRDLRPTQSHLEREIAFARTALALTQAQIDSVMALIKAQGIETSSATPGPATVAVATEAQDRARLMAAVSHIVADPHSKALAAWKQRLSQMADRVRRRDVPVWVLSNSGALEVRHVDLGVMDERFAELVGGSLTEGDRVVVKSREGGRF
ncbi:MAG: efflux RND transporter periplasmic adaptor subunit [Hyphomicrobiaceae bacterium]